MTTRIGCFAVIVAASIGLAGESSASEFYGVTYNGVLTRFDMDAQTVTSIGNIQAGPFTPTQFEDLEFDGSGTLYAIRGYNDGNFPPTNFNEAYRITNLATGSALLSASFTNATAKRHANIAYDYSSGQFYSNRNSDGHLGTVDLTTGAFNDISGVPNGMRNYVEALAIDPTSGEAYAIMDMGLAIFGQIDFSLVRMNLVTGQATLVGSFGDTTKRFKALRFDESGTLYTVAYETGGVYTVDVNTGAATFLFNGGPAAMQTTGLAISIPAPGVAGLLVAAGHVGSRRRR